MTRRLGHCHKQIAEIAKEAAAEHYEVLMSASNFSFDSWKKTHPDLHGPALQAAFVREHWGKYLGFARATLAQLLLSPTIDETQKEAIVDILALDSSLTRGRGNVGPPSRVLNPHYARRFMKK